MATLLQRLLVKTLHADDNSVLFTYLETVLPAIERECDRVPLNTKPHESPATPSLLVSILNSLLTAWNLLPLLNADVALSEDEQRILCLSLTLSPYNQWDCSKDPSIGSNPVQMLERYKTIGNRLNFDTFWADWHEYLAELTYLTQTTLYNPGKKSSATKKAAFKISENRLNHILRPLLAFGTIAAQLTDPADHVTKPEDNSLQEHLRLLGIHRKLIYHRSRHYMGLLTQCMHNAMMHFVKDLNWQPILFFAQGVVYLAPEDSGLPDRAELQKFLWEQIGDRLTGSMLQGKVGFKRDGKGLKAAPQTLELFSPAQWIRNLPQIIQSYVKNEEDPATPKRLAKLNLNPKERKSLANGADLRADRLAEFIILVQQKFFKNRPEFVTWMLEKMELQAGITPEHIKRYAGSVNLGWYHAAARWVAQNSTLDFLERLHDLAEQLATWAEQNNLLPAQHSPTREVFYDYVTQYLEIQGWDMPLPSFQTELIAYVTADARAAKQPICSLSSGEFPSEEQMDSVVLFKPQQYSNKNPLGGRQLKRGISKIWSLEMLLRQAAWSVPAGKLEERQPVFLYIYPASLHAPQLTATLHLLVKDIKHVNLWKIRKYWVENGMDAYVLRSFSWLEIPQPSEDTGSEPEAQEGKIAVSEQADLVRNLPFVALTYTTTREKTITDAWVKPIFLALVLPMLLGVKVVATSSAVPPYNSGSDFQEVVKLEGSAGFWQLMQIPDSLDQIQSLPDVLNRLLVAYSLHLDTQSDPPDANWGALNGTVRNITTDILNIFLLAKNKLRRDNAKHEPAIEEVQRYWHYAHIWAQGALEMQAKLKVTQQLVSEYRKFYRASPHESSHTVLLPFSKALEHILSVPVDWDDDDMIGQGAGQIKAALDRQEIYKRPIMLDKDLDYEVRQLQEMEAICTFMTTCVKQVFRELCKGDRALLQEQRNRIKAGVEFAYRQLAFQEKQDHANQKQGKASQRS